MTNRPTCLHRGAGSGAAGFTLIELLCAMGIAGILSSIAYPSFQGVVHKARRSDALVAIMQVQAAQERFRANHVAYGSLADIGASGTSSTGGYMLGVIASSAYGYQVLASAVGNQRSDSHCRHLRLTVDGANSVYASGPDAAVANAAPLNKQCWSL